MPFDASPTEIVTNPVRQQIDVAIDRIKVDGWTKGTVAMPFDGANTRGAKAVYVIDRMLELFDGGKHWHRGWAEKGEGGGTNRCLVSAMKTVRKYDGISGDRTSHYLGLAIRHRYCTSIGIMEFNDNYATTYDTIERVLRDARELASSDV